MFSKTYKIFSSVPDFFPLNLFSLFFNKLTNTVYSASGNNSWKIKNLTPIIFTPSPKREIFIQKTANNLLIQATKNEPISIYDLENNSLINQIQAANISPHLIQVSDQYLIFSSSNEIHIINLNSLSSNITISIHKHNIHKLALSSTGKILSASDEICYSDISSDEIFKFGKQTSKYSVENDITEISSLFGDSDFYEAKNFLYTENLRFVFILEEFHTDIWDLNRKTLIFILDESKTNQVYSTIDDKFLVFTDFQINFRGCNRLKMKNSTIDVVNAQTFQFGIGILNRDESKFAVWKDNIVYLNPEGLVKSWEIRDVPVIAKDLLISSCCQEGNYLYMGSVQSHLYLFDAESGQELKKVNIYPARPIALIALNDEFVIVGTDYEIKIAKKDDFTRVIGLNISFLSDFCCLDNIIVAVTFRGEVMYYKIPTFELIYSSRNAFSIFTSVRFVSPYVLISCKNQGIHFSTPFFSLQVWPATREKSFTCLHTSPQYIAAGCSNGQLLYWSIDQTLENLSNASDAPVFNKIKGNLCEIKSISISPSSTHILYLAENICRIWCIKTLCHVFSFESVYSSFFNTSYHLSLIISDERSLKTYKVLESDTKQLSKKSILLFFYKRKIKIF